MWEAPWILEPTLLGCVQSNYRSPRHELSTSASSTTADFGLDKVGTAGALGSLVTAQRSFVLTNELRALTLEHMKSEEMIATIQRAYPQLWFACHIEHRTRNQHRGIELTDRDVGILAHVETTVAMTASMLSAHLGIGKAALSQHIKRLQGMGLLTCEVHDRDRRLRRIALTQAGRRAVTASSPLDGARVRQLLQLVPASERVAAVEGLGQLAVAAQRLQKRLSDQRKERKL